MKCPGRDTECATLRWQREYEKSLNTRVTVEQYLFDCASGKRPTPTADECRELALKLGVPDYWRNPR